MAQVRPLTAMDRLLDEAHFYEACGCGDCGRLGLQWGQTKDRWWVSFVFVNSKGEFTRVEHDGKTLMQAAERLWAAEFEEEDGG